MQKNKNPLNKNCSGAHGLKEFNTPEAGYQCDECVESMSKNDKMFGCRVCDFDLCTDCYYGSDNKEKEEEKEEKEGKKEEVKFILNENGSLTFYPTPNIVKGKEKFATQFFVRSSKCPGSFEGAFDYTKEIVDDKLVTQTTKNSFINCAELAYAKHYPLLIKPEHIFLLILQSISIHVDKNAEKLRSKYVFHKKGKMKLVVQFGSDFVRKSPNNNWNGIISSFVSQIDKNTKKDIVPLFTSDFSSSTLTEQIAAKITLMSTCKNYFEYHMMRCVCGYPEITLDGNINDWILLKKKINKLLSDKVDKKFGAKWKVSLLPILDRFIAAFKGDISMVFWNSMIYKGQWSYWRGTGGYGRGGQVKAYKKFISGWINVFFPYVGKKNYENSFCFIPYSGDNYAKKQYKGYKHDKHKNNELWQKLGPELNDFNDGIAEAPVIYTDQVKNESLDLKFKAGFVGFEQDQKTLQLSTTVGWYIDKEKENKYHY